MAEGVCPDERVGAKKPLNTRFNKNEKNYDLLDPKKYSETFQDFILQTLEKTNSEDSFLRKFR